MLPKTLALVDDDSEYAEFLAQYLREQGAVVSTYADSSDLLAEPGALDHDFYILDLMLPGVDGLELIRILRRRTRAGILVVSGQLAPDVFRNIVNAGADMYLAKPVQFEQVLLAVKAVQRRVAPVDQAAPPWRLDRRARELVAPDGARVALSDSDVVVMECLLSAGGEAVSRENLLQRLGGGTEAEAGDRLNAAIYRLRRRIERATPVLVPLQAKSRVGYLFKAPLEPA
jgi:two-component system, OmpR family, response regulator